MLQDAKTSLTYLNNTLFQRNEMTLNNEKKFFQKNTKGELIMNQEFKSFASIFQSYYEDTRPFDERRKESQKFKVFLNNLHINVDYLKIQKENVDPQNLHYGFDLAGEEMLLNFFQNSTTGFHHDTRKGKFRPEYKEDYRKIIVQVCTNMKSLKLDEEEIEKQYVMFWGNIFIQLNVDRDDALEYLNGVSLLADQIREIYTQGPYRHYSGHLQDLIFISMKMQEDLVPFLTKWEQRIKKMHEKKTLFFQQTDGLSRERLMDVVYSINDALSNLKENEPELKSTIANQEKSFKENELERQAIFDLTMKSGPIKGYSNLSERSQEALDKSEVYHLLNMTGYFKDSIEKFLNDIKVDVPSDSRDIYEEIISEEKMGTI